MPKTYYKTFHFHLWSLLIILNSLLLSGSSNAHAYNIPDEGLPLYYWQEGKFTNFGDHLSLKIVERIVGQPVRLWAYKKNRSNLEKKIIAVGSILFFANENDVVWGSGVNGKRPDKKDYFFTNLDVRAVRGPLTRDFLMNNFGIDCPEIYGDPALLIPYLFPELQKNRTPNYDYVIVPHYTEKKMFPKELYPNVVYPTDPWDEVVKKILDSKFVISSSLHGLIVAEAYNIPARMLRITNNEPILKYQDYYLGTNRPSFEYATSIEDAIRMGGEPSFECDLEKLYQSFPFEFWPNAKLVKPSFKMNRS